MASDLNYEYYSLMRLIVDVLIFFGYNDYVENDDLLTVPEASKLLGVTGGAVHIAMTTGRLPFLEKYGRKLIARPDLEVYKKRTQPEGVKKVGRPCKVVEAVMDGGDKKDRLAGVGLNVS